MKFLNAKIKSLSEQKTKSSTKINYKVYKPKGQELIRFYIAATIILAFLAFLFYKSLVAIIISTSLLFVIKKYYSLYKLSKRKEKLSCGFRDVLYSISASIAGGRQMPQAIEDAAYQIGIAYGKESDIAVEMRSISNEYYKSHADIGDLLLGFGERSGIDEIIQFAQSYRICRKCGADLEEVCLKSAGLLLGKMDFQNEVKMLVSQKKYDIMLLTLMPIAVLLFLNLTSQSYIEMYYTSLSGRLIMSLCLILIASALLWGMRITDIKL